MEHKVLVLARPTQGDANFYKRWERAGEVAPVGHAYRIDAITVLVVDQHTDNLIEHPNVKYVCSATTGHTHLGWVPPHVKLITLRGERAFLEGVTSVSEYVFRIILDMYRPMTKQGVRLRGKTIGIVGYGRIGHQVKKLAEAFGCPYFRYDKLWADASLPTIFGESDIVSLHLEENESTRGIITGELVRKLRPHALLINTARPSLLTEEAHEYMCHRGGYAHDFAIEPYLDHVWATPHIAGSTLEDRVATDEFIVEKLLKQIDRDRSANASV